MESKKEEQRTVTHVVRKEEDRNSVKFAINAKGKWSAEVKVYAETIEDAFNNAEQFANNAECLLMKKNEPEKYEKLLEDARDIRNEEIKAKEKEEDLIEDPVIAPEDKIELTDVFDVNKEVSEDGN